MKVMLVMMEEATHADRLAVQEKRAAMHRFLLCNDLSAMLKKKAF
jgi:hypothetical protein